MATFATNLPTMMAIPQTETKGRVPYVNETVTVDVSYVRLAVSGAKNNDIAVLPFLLTKTLEGARNKRQN